MTSEIKLPQIYSKAAPVPECNHTTLRGGTLEEVRPHVYRCKVCGRMLMVGGMLMERVMRDG